MPHTLSSKVRYALPAALSLVPRLAHGQSTIALADSLAILGAVWRSTTLSTPRAAVLLSHVADSESVISFSAELREVLRRDGIQVSDHIPATDDTVAFRVIAWRADSVGIIVRLRSTWTEVIGRGARRCRAASVNLETFRVRCSLGTWVAERIEPILHGDNACAPIR